MRLAAGLLLLVSIAGADSFVRVERKDWVADWSVYVMRSTVTATGKVLRFFSPGPRARREIVLRPDFEAQVAAGMRKVGNAMSHAADLLVQGPLKLLPLQVVDLSVDDHTVRGVEVAGEAVLAFWTVTHDGHSMLYLQGRKPGRATVRVSLNDGAVRLFPVDVL